MQGLVAINDTLNRLVWGPGMLVLLLGVGIYFTVRTRGFQLTHFFAMLQKTLGALFTRKAKANPGALSPVQAMTTALAATMGTGNLVGVATALAWLAAHQLPRLLCPAAEQKVLELVRHNLLK